MKKFLKEGIKLLMNKLGDDLNLRDLNQQDLVLVFKHYWNVNPHAMAWSMFQGLNTEIDFPGMYFETDPATDPCHAERRKWCDYNLNVFVQMAYATFIVFLSAEADQRNESAAHQNLR